MKAKKCNICTKLLPIEFFHLHKVTKDGHRPMCKDCDYELVKKWRKKNPEKRKKQTKDYWETVKLKREKSEYLESLK